MEEKSVFNFREAAGNRIFGARFTKADGTIRTGTFRMGVSKNTNGRGLAYSPSACGNVIVWDMSLGAYRTIKLDRLQTVSMRGSKFNMEAQGGAA